MVQPSPNHPYDKKGMHLHTSFNSNLIIIFGVLVLIFKFLGLVVELDFRTINTSDGTAYQCCVCPRAKPTTNREKHWRSAAHQKHKELEAVHSAANHSRATHDVEMYYCSEDPPQHQTREASWGMEEEPQLVLNKDKPFVMKTLEEELDEISSKEILKPTSPDDEWEDVLEDELPEDEQATEIEEQPIVRFDKRSNHVNTSVWYPFKSKHVS